MFLEVECRKRVNSYPTAGDSSWWSPLSRTCFVDSEAPDRIQIDVGMPNGMETADSCVYTAWRNTNPASLLRDPQRMLRLFMSRSYYPMTILTPLSAEPARMSSESNGSPLSLPYSFRRCRRQCWIRRRWRPINSSESMSAFICQHLSALGCGKGGMAWGCCVWSRFSWVLACA